MRELGENGDFAVGFVTVVESPEHGFLGGLLLLNRFGRPIEFHCTAPVKPSRAHEILYGPTLRPYLFGERIAQSLLAKAGVEPVLLLTDLEEVMSVAVPHGTMLVRIEACRQTEAALTITSQSLASQSLTTEDVIEDRSKFGAEDDALCQDDSTLASESSIGTGSELSAGADREASEAQVVAWRIVAASSDSDETKRAMSWLESCNGLNPLEPFGRIRDALAEAEKVARPIAPGGRTGEAA